MNMGRKNVADFQYPRFVAEPLTNPQIQLLNSNFLWTTPIPESRNPKNICLCWTQKKSSWTLYFFFCDYLL